MLTYATILIASLIVAVVALFFYKVVSDSSRSVYKSKTPIAIISNDPTEKKGKARHGAATGTLNSPNRSSGVTPRNLAQTVPAMPTETVEWGWKGSANQGREQQSHPETAAAEGSHCSLYDVNVKEPEPKHQRNTGWPYREERPEPGGKVYKVKRRSSSRTSSPQTINKPWGW